MLARVLGHASQRIGHVRTPLVLLRPPRLGALYAGGVLLFGVWGATYLLTPPKVHLDGGEIPRRNKHFASSLVSPLQWQKSLDKYGSRSAVDIDKELRKHESSHITNRKTGISRYDVVQFASNNPTEDDHAESLVPTPSGHWAFFSVLDGHSGWETSAWLRENLIPAVCGALADLYSKLKDLDPAAPSPAAPEIDRTIQHTFLRLDDDIVHSAVEKVFSSTSRLAAINLLAPAYAGSCALLAFYDSDTRLLRVALTGDSRAVLGRRTTDKNGNFIYEAHVLSVEQDGHNVAEEYRLNAHHPGEAVVVNGRVLGMGPSRAFGDARYKWNRDIQERLKRSYLGRTPLAHVKTPPYLTAEPEVTTWEVKPGDFLILGTDGLWECLSSEEAVGLVGLWKDRDGTPNTSDSALAPRDLPVNMENEDDSIRYRQWGVEKRFVNHDRNAATHLVRNALGGAEVDLTAALLSMRAPRSRTYIDDMTAVVVFFDDKEQESN
ncbi:phosphatase 2C-like domain-containing protein [Amylocystis lapponica]|nr:phosphatase 2C-like domain-containing protein [Amylocystis lapponica]